MYVVLFCTNKARFVYNTANGHVHTFKSLE